MPDVGWERLSQHRPLGRVDQANDGPVIAEAILREPAFHEWVQLSEPAGRVDPRDNVEGYAFRVSLARLGTPGFPRQGMLLLQPLQAAPHPAERPQQPRLLPRAARRT